MTKLVESGDARRAVPVISFIARQRDLRELLGTERTERTGAEVLSFQDQLSSWDGRFATVQLEDRNLPLIAEQRILTPLPGAAEQITAAFQHTAALPASTRDVLLSDGDTEVTDARTVPVKRNRFIQLTGGTRSVNRGIGCQGQGVSRDQGLHPQPACLPRRHPSHRGVRDQLLPG